MQGIWVGRHRAYPSSSFNLRYNEVGPGCSRPRRKEPNVRDYRNIKLQGKPLLQIVKQYKLLTLDGKRKPLVKADLSRASLSAVDLSELSFVEANFESSDLSMANLSLTDFTATELRFANLVQANLSGAVFQSCDFSHANLRGANLGNTTFDDVNFCGTDLQRVKLLATIMEHILYDDDTIWPNDMERFGFDLKRMTTWQKVEK